MSYVSIPLTPHGLAGGDLAMAFPAINIFSNQRNTKGDRRLAVTKRKEGDRIFSVPRLIAPPPLHLSRHLLFLLSPACQVEVESDQVIKKCSVHLV